MTSAEFDQRATPPPFSPALLAESSDAGVIKNLAQPERGEDTLPIAKGYPERAAVPLARRSWSVACPEYSPVEYESKRLAEQDRTKVPGGWADPADVSREEFLLRSRSGYIKSYEGPIQHDPENGRPLNPDGRTGITGRGALGKWGANHAADALLTRVSDETGALEVLLILRPSGEWAIPGGMLDPGESALDATRRELEEETTLTLDATRGRLVYQGLGDGPRNTDNAWIETTVYHFHLDRASSVQQQTPQAQSDAKEVKWFAVTPELIASLYANHGALVSRALTQFRSFEPTMSDQVRQQLAAIPHSPLLTSFSELRGKVGIFGGSFDPLHNAHLELARNLKETHSLDAVVFVPAGQNPLKERQTIATPRQRVEMVAEALRGEEGMFVAPIQTRRDGPSYTIDMIDSIRAELPAEQATLFLIMGADCVEQLPRWRDHEKLLEQVELLPCSRGGQENRHDADSLFASLAPTLGEEAARKATRNFTEIGAGDLSSTEIRNQLRQGLPATGVPPGVARMIERAGLYREVEGE